MDVQSSNRNKIVKLTLYQWGPKPDWKLPSFDPQCLIVQAFMKFAGVPYDVNNCNNPHMSPSNTLPMLVVNGEKIITDYHEILNFLMNMGYNLDQNLNAAQKADVRAYSAMLDEILYSAQLYNWWMEPDNYSTVTHLTFSRALPFPLSWVLPRRMKQRVTARLNSHNMNNAERSYSEAECCYQALSDKLSEKRFFFGDHPSSLDAIVFGYLATQLLPPFKNRKLQDRIAQHNNLVRFCNHILENYFNQTPVEVNYGPVETYTKKIEEAENGVQLTSEEARIQQHNKLAVLFGIATTLLYMFATNKQIQRISQQYLGNYLDTTTEDNNEEDEDSLFE